MLLGTLSGGLVAFLRPVEQDSRRNLSPSALPDRCLQLVISVESKCCYREVIWPS